MTEYRAPSWSWLSVDGRPLYFRAYQSNSYQPYRCEFVECQTTFKSKSLPYGEVTGGFLKLRAVPREGQLHASGSHQITWQDLADEQTRAKDSACESGKYWNGARGVSDTLQDNVDGPIVCLPTYMAENANVGKVDGLMLSTTRDGLFRRIGCFVTNRSDFDHLPQQRCHCHLTWQG